jgi:hypothetical protein
MNDNELSTMVRESVAEIHAFTPVAQIISRGRAVRARRRIPAVAGVLAMTAAAALAATTLLAPGHSGLLASGHPGLRPSGHPGSRSASARLAAWTVAVQANGDIDVTINQLKDPAGLQATLRADGLPVTVSFSGPLMSASCQGYDASQSTLNAVARIHRDYLAIDPSALPSGTGLAIFDEPGAGLPSLSPSTPTLGSAPRPAPTPPPLLSELNGPLAIGLVYASQQCTG